MKRRNEIREANGWRGKKNNRKEEGRNEEGMKMKEKINLIQD